MGSIRTWKRMVRHASGAVQVLLMAPATPPARRWGTVLSCGSSPLSPSVLFVFSAFSVSFLSPFLSSHPTTETIKVNPAPTLTGKSLETDTGVLICMDLKSNGSHFSRQHGHGSQIKWFTFFKAMWRIHGAPKNAWFHIKKLVACARPARALYIKNIN
jgi:hypothetical protein